MLPFVSVDMPGNIHSLLKSLFPVVTFNIINSDGLTYSLSRRLGLDLAPVNPRLVAMDIETSSQIINLGFVFVFCMILVYIGVFMLLSSVITTRIKYFNKYEATVHSINTAILRRLNWPFFTRLFLETYMVQAVAQLIRLKGARWTPWTEGCASYMAITNVNVLAAVPVLTGWFLFKYREILDKEFVKEKFGFIYDNVRVNSLLAVPYPVIFMVKRLLLVTIVLVFDGNGLLQSFLVINLLLICCCYDWAAKPLVDPLTNFQDGIFDFIALLNAYTLVCYTDFNPSKRAQYELGWFMYSVLVVVVSGFVGCTVGSTVIVIKRRSKIYYRVFKAKLVWLKTLIIKFFKKADPLPLESEINLFVKRDTIPKIELGNE